MESLDGGRAHTRGALGPENPRAAKADVYFELGSTSPQHLACVLRARHGLTELRDLNLTFRSDPGKEVNPDRAFVAADGLSAPIERSPVPIVNTGWLIIERFNDGGGPTTYLRIRSFESYRGAVAEFATKLDLYAVGTLEVAQRAPIEGQPELRFIGLERTMSLVPALS